MYRYVYGNGKLVLVHALYMLALKLGSFRKGLEIRKLFSRYAAQQKRQQTPRHGAYRVFLCPRPRSITGRLHIACTAAPDLVGVRKNSHAPLYEGLTVHHVQHWGKPGGGTCHAIKNKTKGLIITIRP